MSRPNRRQFGTLALLIGLTSSHCVPEAAAQAPPPETPSEVARFLAGEGAIVSLPSEGSVKRSIKEDTPTFTLPDGVSSAMLLQLPDYRGPYALTVVSSRIGMGRTTEIFVPSGVFFDAEFQPVAAFGEDRLFGRGETLQLAAELTVGDANRETRYLLLYTRGDRVGQQQVITAGQDAPFGVFARLFQKGRLIRFERALEGNIEVSTSVPRNQRELARSFAELQALIESGDRVRVSFDGGRRVDGRVVALSSALRLLVDDSPLEVQNDDVWQIERRGDPLGDGLRRGLFYGLSVGSGFLLGLEPPPAEALSIVAISGGLGAGLGAAMDWARRGWTLVYLQPALPPLTASLSPVITADGVGVRLTLGF